MKKVTIDDVLEVNERLKGYHGMHMLFSIGMAGQDLDLEMAKNLSKIITEVINKKSRKKFIYTKKSNFSHFGE